jgi:hypothetical protein
MSLDMLFDNCKNSNMYATRGHTYTKNTCKGIIIYVIL